MKNKRWTYSIILSVCSIASFFLPWFVSTSSASIGGQSFSKSFEASPAAALVVYIPWLALAALMTFLAYRKSRFAFLPALLNFYPIFSAIGIFGKQNSIAYSGYGASVSSSTHTAYGFWIFASATILFFLATIGELFKKKLITEIQSPVITQNKRTLEDLKQAKQLLDIDAISQEEYDRIKADALGDKPVKKIETEQVAQSPVNIITPTENKIIDSTIANQKFLSPSKRKPIIIISVVVFLALVGFLASKYSTKQDEFNLPEEDTSVKEFNEEELPTQMDNQNDEPNSATNNNNQLPDNKQTKSTNEPQYLLTQNGERYREITIRLPEHFEEDYLTTLAPIEGYYKSDENNEVWRVFYNDLGELKITIFYSNGSTVQDEINYQSNGFFYVQGLEFEIEPYMDRTIASNQELIIRDTETRYKWIGIEYNP